MWKYIHTDELYHYGIPGMKWGYRRARSVSKSGNTRSVKSTKKQSSNNTSNKKWSTKKKVAVGIAATTALVAGAYGAKKFRDYIRNENRQIAMNKGLKAANRSWNDWYVRDGRMYDLKRNPNSPVLQRLRGQDLYDPVQTMANARRQVAEASYNRVYNRVNNVNFTKALGNVIEEKRKRY